MSTLLCNGKFTGVHFGKHLKEKSFQNNLEMIFNFLIEWSSRESQKSCL